MHAPQTRSDSEQRRIGTTFTDAELAQIDEWGFSRKIRNRSEVIRQLVKNSLAETKTATE